MAPIPERRQAQDTAQECCAVLLGLRPRQRNSTYPVILPSASCPVGPTSPTAAKVSSTSARKSTTPTSIRVFSPGMMVAEKNAELVDNPFYRAFIVAVRPLESLAGVRVD
jgi:hypothetical protein